MRNYLRLPLLLLLVMCLCGCGVESKPLGISYQTQPHYLPYNYNYYSNYYPQRPGPAFGHNYGLGFYGGVTGPYSSYQHYAPGQHYGPLDIGIGALSLTPFLL